MEIIKRYLKNCKMEFSGILNQDEPAFEMARFI